MSSFLWFWAGGERAARWVRWGWGKRSSVYVGVYRHEKWVSVDVQKLFVVGGLRVLEIAVFVNVFSTTL